jgi:dihydrolipoamide dehydrogenase
MVDQQVAKDALRHLKKQGLDVRLGAKVTGAVVEGDAVKVRYETHGATQEVTVDVLVVAVGRKPVTAGLFGPDVKVPLDKRGFIEVDAQCRTSVPNIWAVGDVVRGPMLAHKGMEEGVMVAESCRACRRMNYRTIPSVIYTAPRSPSARPKRCQPANASAFHSPRRRAKPWAGRHGQADAIRSTTTCSAWHIAGPSPAS